MIKDCLKVFEKILDSEDKIIIENYIPADGTYIIISKEEERFKIKDIVNIKYNRKNNEIEGKTSFYYSDICFYDYNSKVIDMNKPIDKKKIIQSNNYLSFIIKKESLQNGKLNEERIDQYYEVLANPYLKYSDSKAKEIYKKTEENLGEVDKKELESIKTWIKTNIFNLDIDISGKDYLKIFFEYPYEKYSIESKRYLIPNIYNSNSFNIKINDEIFGLPNDNMGLNAKKPYLENKSRKISVPYLIDSNEVNLQKKFFDYLMNLAIVGKVNVFISDNKIVGLNDGEFLNDEFNGIFLRLKKGKEVEIHYFDTITGYRPDLKKVFQFKDIFDMDTKDLIKEKYGTYKKKNEIQEIIDSVLFFSFLKNNYFREASDISIKDSTVLKNMLISRNLIFDWLWKDRKSGVYPVLNKITINLIKNSINKGFFIKARHQFNFMCSIDNYFNGGLNMADTLLKIKNDLREKINSKDTEEFSSDKEYYFAVGQLVNYFISKNKSKNKSQSLVNPFINSKSNKFIKDKLLNLYKKYNYDIEVNSKRFGNLYSMVLAYEAEGNIDQNMIIAGYLNSNLIYEKKEEEK